MAANECKVVTRRRRVVQAATVIALVGGCAALAVAQAGRQLSDQSSWRATAADPDRGRNQLPERATTADPDQGENQVPGWAAAVSASEPFTSVFARSDTQDRAANGSETKIHRLLARKLAEIPAIQTTKAWVLFSDKGLATRAEYDSAIDATASTYNRRAIERRIKRRTRPGLFDEHDLPVVPAYIAVVETTGARVHIVSKWVNGVSVYGTKAQFERIEQLAFVKSIQHVKRARKIEPAEQKNQESVPAGNSASRTNTGGGDTCALATVITGLPYSDAGSTSGFADDYAENGCPFDSSGSADVVYAYTPVDDVVVDIQLCNDMDYWSTMYVYENTCPGTGPVGCAELCYSVNYWGGSVIFDLPLTGGSTYYIVIDGATGWEGNYVLDVTEATVYGRSNDQLEQINLKAVHDLGFTGTDVIVGVLDSGFWTTHEAFNEPSHPLNIVAAYDFVDNDGDVGSGAHGTWVLSIMGAYKPDVLLGGAYDASFILCRTEDGAAEYRGEEDNFVAGLEFIEANGGDMMTASLGYLVFDDPADSYTQADLNGLTAICTIGTNIATGNGVHCVNSGGNSGHDADPNSSHLGAPTDAFDVIGVGAVYGTGEIVFFSSDGPTADGRVKPEVLARGMDTRVVNANDDLAYTAFAGTSAAAPVAASAVACLIDAHPEWSVAAMRQALFDTADYYVANGTHDPEYVLGYGIIDTLAALFAGPPGACCDGDTCTVAKQASCLSAGGLYLGADVSCTASICPCVNAGGMPEGEPTCLDDYDDIFNGGCNSPVISPPTSDCCVDNGSPGCDDATCEAAVCTVDSFCCDTAWDQVCAGIAVVECPVLCPPAIYPYFSEIACGDTVCGTGGNYLFNTVNEFRDTDWYEVTVTQSTALTWDVVAEFPVSVFIIEGTLGCDALAILESAAGDANVPVSITAFVGPGTYWLFVATQDFVGTACGTSYTASLSCLSSTPPLPAAPPHDGAKNRYLSLDPNNGATLVALEVTLSDNRTCWIGEPCLRSDTNDVDPQWLAECVQSAAGDGSDMVRDWSSYTDPVTGNPVVHVRGCVVLPNETYDVRAIAVGEVSSAALTIGTVPAPAIGSWADIVGDFTGGLWTAPNSNTNFKDVNASIQSFQQLPTAPPVSWVDLVDIGGAEVPNYKINFNDVGAIIRGFLNTPYPGTVATCAIPATRTDCP